MEKKTKIRKEGREEVMALSKRAKARMKMASAAEKKAIKAAAKTLHNAELLGSKRAAEIRRAADR